MGALDELEARGRRRETFAFGAGDSVVRVDLQAMEPTAYEALAQAHLAADGLQNRETFLPALAAACTGETVERWEGIIRDVLSAGEVNGLYQCLLVLNYGTLPPEALGKG